jgi:hypothetical protein
METNQVSYEVRKQILRSEVHTLETVRKRKNFAKNSSLRSEKDYLQHASVL